MLRHQILAIIQDYRNIPFHLVTFFIRAYVILALISSWINSSLDMDSSSSRSANAFPKDGAATEAVCFGESGLEPGMPSCSSGTSGR